VLARLAETYFIYAEACIGLDDYTTAADYVQDVLDRPGNAKSGTLTNSIASATTQQEALEQYLIESGRNSLVNITAAGLNYAEQGCWIHG